MSSEEYQHQQAPAAMGEVMHNPMFVPNCAIPGDGFHQAYNHVGDGQRMHRPEGNATPLAERNSFMDLARSTCL